MPAIAVIIAQIIDIAVGAITKHPEYEPHLGPVLANLIPIFSQAVGETADQTTARRAANAAVVALYANAPVIPVKVV
jgi:hypothetical protein